MGHSTCSPTITDVSRAVIEVVPRSFVDDHFHCGTLDLLILKAVSWGPTHGYGVARWIEQVTFTRFSHAVFAALEAPPRPAQSLENENES